MLNSTFSTIKQYFHALDARLTKLEELRSLLPDDDKLTNDLDDEALNNKIRDIAEGVLENSEVIINPIETKVKEGLDDYDPTAHSDFEDEVQKIISDSDFGQDQIRNFLEDKVSISLEVSRY